MHSQVNSRQKLAFEGFIAHEHVFASYALLSACIVAKSFLEANYYLMNFTSTFSKDLSFCHVDISKIILMFSNEIFSLFLGGGKKVF